MARYSEKPVKNVGEARDRAINWFTGLLDDSELWDQAAIPSVVNDYGIIKSLSNTLITYQDDIKKLKNGAMPDQRSVTEQLKDLKCLALTRGMYDAVDWINLRIENE